MRETIARVEKRGEELKDELNDSIQNNVLFSDVGSLEDAAGSSNDRHVHQTYEVPVGPICSIDPVPEVVSDASICSSKGDLKEPPESISTATSTASNNVQLIQDTSTVSASVPLVAK